MLLNRVQQAGMTLIEVLIASVILFMTVALVAVIYQQNFKSQQTVEKYINDAQEFDSIVAAIQFQLEQGKVKGTENVGRHKYHWVAKRLQAEPQINSISPETGNAIGSGGLMNLFDVTVDSEDSKSHFNFKQAVWLSSAG